MSLWKKTKEIARQGVYLVKNKDEVQKRVLETTRDDDDQITENEFLTVAHLTYDAAALSSIRKTLWKRFIRIQDCPASCRKALQVLDYIVRYGSPSCREMAKNGIGELQMVANSHHFSSDKPREYMNEDQCRNLVQNFLSFLNNDDSYKQARQNGQSTIQRAENFYVEPLQVKIKTDNGTTQMTSQYYQSQYQGNSGGYGNSYGGGNSYGNTNSSSTYGGGNSYGNSNNRNSYGSGNSYGNTNNNYNNQSSNNYTTQNNNPYTFSHDNSQQNQNSSQGNASNQIDWASDDELDEDPRLASKQGSQNSYQQGSQGGYQQQQSNPFQQQQQSNPFQQQNSQGGYQQQQQQQSNPFQQQSSQGGYQQQSNPFQQQNSQGGYQQQQSNPFQQQSSQNSFQQPAPVQHQQSGFSVFNNQPVSQQSSGSYQQPNSSFSSQPSNQQFGQQPSQFSSQNYQSQQSNNQQANFFSSTPSQPTTLSQPSYQQQSISADEMLFGSPTPAQPAQQPVQAPQADPAYDGILDFSNIPMQPRGTQQTQQNKSSGGMLDEFGDLVDLNLQKKPLREHGRPEQNIQRGYGNTSQRPPNQQYNPNQYNQYNQNQYNQYNQNQYNQRPY